MVISLILLFIICLSLNFLEERLSHREKLIIYYVLGAIMILIAGLREVGSTPDSASYEEMFYAKEGDLMVLLREPSFSMIVDFLRSYNLGINSLFFVYALLSIPVHLAAFWKLSKLPLLTLTIYISYYYMMHDLVQIRCAVASGLFLWAIYFYVERKPVLTLLFILIGIFFHFSAAAGLIIFFLGNGFPRWQRYLLYAIVPVGLVVYVTHIDIFSLVPDELGGLKLMKYRTMREKGIEDELAGWKLGSNLLIWMNIVLYYACIYYHDYLVKHFKYTSVAIKLQGVGFIFLFFVNALSMVVGNRMCDYFSIASVLLWTASVYAFTPIIIGKIINNAISAVRFVASVLAYGLALMFM
jgi:hypothetical protein